MRIFISLFLLVTISPQTISQVQSQLSQSRSASQKPALQHPENWGPDEIDYLLPNEHPEASAKNSSQFSASSTLELPVETTVEYTSFTFGTTLTLKSFQGKYVSYLIPENKIGGDGLSREELLRVLDLTDILYAHMAELVGAEPAGDGPLKIALLDPGRDFGGRGWVGQKGVELYYAYMSSYKKDVLAGCVPNPIIHEMAHNFDVYRDYISHDGNNAHAWTAFLITYIQVYSESGAAWQGRVVATSRLLEQTISDYLNTWDAAGSTASWSACVKNGTGCEAKEIYANIVWGGLLLRFAALHRPATMRKVFSWLREYKNAHPDVQLSAEAKNDVLVKSLAESAGQDIGCELQMWNWPASAPLIDELKLSFPGPNSFCQDNDGDGFAPARDDRDDFNSLIRPGGTESLNGIDDDSNGIVDDVIVEEQADVPAGANAQVVSVPSRIIGRTATTEDHDSFRLDVASPTQLNVRLTGRNRRFSGWLEIRYAGNTGSIVELSSNVAGGTAVHLDRAGTWLFTVMPWSGGDEGYELFLSAAENRPLPRIRFLPSSKPSLLMLQVTVDSDAARQVAPDQVRLWIEGVGFLGATPFEESATIKLKPTAIPLNAGIRAQLLKSGLPASTVSRATTQGTLRITRIEPDVRIPPDTRTPADSIRPSDQVPANRMTLINQDVSLMLTPIITIIDPNDTGISRSRCIPRQRLAGKEPQQANLSRARRKCARRTRNQ
ncbi:MAG TPA: hypothetical protein VJ180_01250 [Pyrinomonadaceae bacterium]|nr:hypothetical protein [Pyrinomonadaceae bacterium]